MCIRDSSRPVGDYAAVLGAREFEQQARLSHALDQTDAEELAERGEALEASQRQRDEEALAGEPCAETGCPTPSSEAR
eukprot:1839908-Alexandrium_andersonii.AAC.1